jgi:16S rRNA (uracil1498-N3)-methyltransferase
LRDESDAAKRVARWQRIALEAAKQSGRAVVPEVNIPVSLSSLVETVASDGAMLRLMFSERGGQSLSEGQDLPAKVLSMTALIGSEGGWANEELEAAGDAGWRIVTLGGRTLRAETAAITVAALLQHLYGDLV